MSWSGQSWGPDQPRFAADLTGDKCADIVGFGLDGVWVALNNGDGTFQPPNLVLSGFSAHTGWSVESHPRLPADLTGDGRADIVGFGDAGVWTVLNNGDGTFGPMRFVIADFGYDQGWRVDQHPRVTSPTSPETAGPTSSGSATPASGSALATATARSSRRGSSSTGFGYDQGWRVDQHPRFVVDLTGDGKADIVGYGDAGVWVALGNGDGTFRPAHLRAGRLRSRQGLAGRQAPADDRRPQRRPARRPGRLRRRRRVLRANTGDGTFAAPTFVIADLGYDQGWRVDRHPRLAADVTGDGRDDIVGFGDDGVWVAVTRRQPASKLVLDGFGYNQGWRVDEHPRDLVDLNGDGKADIIGFGDAGVWVALSNGDGTFQPAAFVLADFGLHAGPGRRVDHDRLPHPRRRPERRHRCCTSSSRTAAATPHAPAAPPPSRPTCSPSTDHDADWFGRNPYLGCAVNANTATSTTNRPHTVDAAAALAADPRRGAQAARGPHPHPWPNVERHLEVPLHADDHPRRRHRAAAVQTRTWTASSASSSTRTTATTTASAASSPRIRRAPKPATNEW